MYHVRGVLGWLGGGGRDQGVELLFVGGACGVSTIEAEIFNFHESRERGEAGALCVVVAKGGLRRGC